ATAAATSATCSPPASRRPPGWSASTTWPGRSTCWPGPGRRSSAARWPPCGARSSPSGRSPAVRVTGAFGRILGRPRASTEPNGIPGPMDLLSVIAADSSGGGGSLVSIGVLLLIPVAMYFLLIRPQRRRQRAQQDMQSSLDVGDEVMTASGIYGFITGFED